MQREPFHPRGALAWLPWIAVSALLHAAFVIALVAAGDGEPLLKAPPRALRVQLLRESPAPAARGSAPPAPPVVAGAPPRPAPNPRPPARRAAIAPAPAVAAEKVLEPDPAASEAAAGEAGAPVGAATVTAAVSAAPPGGSPGGDAIAAYVARVRDAIARHKKYPSLARRRGIEGRVTLQLSIASDGSLAHSEALGSPPILLARSALAAVALASPFERPPAGSLRIEVPIRFALNE